MSGPGPTPDGIVQMVLRPSFLRKVDSLSKVLARDKEKAVEVCKELEEVFTKEHLLGMGARRDLYELGKEYNHFRDHWLTHPGLFKDIPVPERVQVLRDAFRTAVQAIIKFKKPVQSSWVAGGSGFTATVDATGPTILLTFYTPKPQFAAGASDPSYVQDDRVQVIQYDAMQGEMIFTPGWRQNDT